MDDDNLNLPPWLLCDGLKNSLVGITQTPNCGGSQPSAQFDQNSQEWELKWRIMITENSHDKLFFSLFFKFCIILYTTLLIWTIV